MKFSHILTQRGLPYLACIAAALFSFYNLFQISVLNVISTDLMKTFQLSSIQLGLFSSIYLIANTLWVIPGGLLLDKYPLRSIALFFSALDILATFIIAKSTLLSLSICMRFLQGLASAMSLLICTRIAWRWFPKKAASAIGLMVAFALLGGVFANSLFAKLALNGGWRHAMWCSGLLGLLFFLIMFCFLKDNTAQPQPNHQQLPILHICNNKRVICNLNNIMHGVYIGFMNLPIFIFATLWGKLYLEQAYNIPAIQAANICALLYAGFIFGAPTLGFISDKIQSRQKPLAIAAIIMLIICLPLLLQHEFSALFLAILFFLMGFVSSVPIVSYVALAENNLANMTSTASSIAFFIANFIGVLAQPLFAFLLNINWHSRYSQHIPLYTIANYQTSLMLLPTAFIACIGISCLLTDSKLFKSNA